jgi:recombination protein RecT
MTEPNKALSIREETVDLILAKVQKFQQHGELDLPPNYSAANALKSAWLILQATVDKDKKPALVVCSRESIANALLDMVVQGLNPAKKQCYFIAYGNALTMQRSYFGTMAVLKQVDPRVDDIVAECVYEGDKFKYQLVRGRKVITEHEQSIDNVDKAKIKAAYCVIYDIDGQIKRTDIMTMPEIMQAWRQSRQYPIDDNGNIKPGSVQGKFTADMAKRTVINRACKALINSSDDSSLVMQAVRRSDDERAEQEVDAEIHENANKTVIDVRAVEPAVRPDPDEPLDASIPPHFAPPPQETMAARGPDF